MAKIDLDEIISRTVGEGQKLDFKSEIDLDNKEKRAAIVDDVVAFLNANGGRILIGIHEDRKTGAVSVNPHTGDADSYCLKLQQILRSNIAAVPANVVVDAISVPGGSVIFVEVEQNNNRPYCNKITGRYLQRRGRKNEPLLPGEVEALRHLRLRLVENVVKLSKDYISNVRQDGFLTLNCPELHFAILPMQHLDPDFPSFNHAIAVYNRKSMTPPNGSNKAFQRAADGYEVTSMDGSGHNIGRFFVGDDWFIHSITCHPIPYVNGEGRVNLAQMKFEIDQHLKDIRYFLATENLCGPFAIEASIVNLHSREHFEQYFPRSKSISFARPMFVESFEPDALVQMIYERVYQSSIYGR